MNLNKKAALSVPKRKESRKLEPNGSHGWVALSRPTIKSSPARAGIQARVGKPRPAFILIRHCVRKAGTRGKKCLLTRILSKGGEYTKVLVEVECP